MENEHQGCGNPGEQRGVSPPVFGMAPRGEESRVTGGATWTFGLDVLLLMTTLLAVLFAPMAWLDLPLPFFAAVVVLLSVAAAGQVLLFGGQRPRQASILAGGGVCIAGWAALVLWCHVSRQARLLDGLLMLMVLAPLAGGVLGYAAGGLIAAVFGLSAWLRHRRS